MCNWLITNMDANSHDGLSHLTAEEMMALLDSPMEEVSSHIKEILKNEFQIVTQKWLITGLLEYFFHSQSKRLLNLIFEAPEHHWKFLMDRILEGLKGTDKFRYLSVLVYAVTKNPTFPLVKKLPDHQIMKEILNIINPNQEKELSIVISGLTILVVLLPTVPNVMSSHLQKMLEAFWMLIHLTPTDSSLKVFLQIAVFSFFQRLYALYPCRLIGFLRYHSESKSLYEKTLYPMLEKVRLHPLLLTETKESEIRKDRWKGKDRHDLIQECAQISSDSFIEIPEGVAYSTHFRSKSNSDKSDPNLGNYVAVQMESNVWSPGVSSPARPSSSIPQVYTTQFSRSACRSSIPESPLETAVEAISQNTTPYDSPFQRELSKPVGNISLDERAKCLPHAGEASSQNAAVGKDMRSLKREGIDHNVQSENFFGNIPIDKNIETGTQDNVAKAEREIDVCRKRKQSVYHKDFGQRDAKSATSIDTIDEEIVDTNEFGRRNSCESDSSSSSDEDEGLGVPSQDNWTELMKSVRTKRLRFLSQCGPPPNIAMLSPNSNVGVLKGSEPQTIPKLKRSRSYPKLASESYGSVSISSPITKKDFKSPSPSKKQMQDFCTQTEEVTVVDHYEQLLAALQLAAIPSPYQETTEQDSKESSFQALEQVYDNLPVKLYTSDIDLDFINLGDETPDNLRHQLRCFWNLLKVEKFRKEIYAERNKRLFSKIKHYHYLSEKQKSANVELRCLRDEVASFKSNHETLNVKIAAQTMKINNMVPLVTLQKVEKEYEEAKIARNYLTEVCKQLAADKSSLEEQLRSSDTKLEDSKRRLKICLKHSEQNEELKAQLISHQKRILLMGEIHREIDSRTISGQCPPNYVPLSQYEQLMDRMGEFNSRLKDDNHDQKSRLNAAMLRIAELEDKLETKEEQISSCHNRMEQIHLDWKEKYDKSTRVSSIPEGSVVNGFKNNSHDRDPTNESQQRSMTH